MEEGEEEKRTRRRKTRGCLFKTRAQHHRIVWTISGWMATGGPAARFLILLPLQLPPPHPFCVRSM
eukprot:2798159-Pyramimonas_sp.AAC.1